MAMLTVHNLPDEVHRALHARAAQRGLSMEDEAREILEAAVAPDDRGQTGSLLVEACREMQLTDEELAIFEGVRDKTPAQPLDIG